MGVGEAPENFLTRPKKSEISPKDPQDVQEVTKRSPKVGIFGSNWFKLVQIRSSWFKMVQTGSNQINWTKLDLIGSKETKLPPPTISFNLLYLIIGKLGVGLCSMKENQDVNNIYLLQVEHLMIISSSS